MSASTDDADAGRHTPVLYQQALTALRPRAGGRYIDGTLGAGGHAAGLLRASSPDGELLGIDRDPAALEAAGNALAEFTGRVHLRRASFADLQPATRRQGWDEVDGILLDLGLSSLQLADSGRGFSFQREGPLDMRFDPAQELTADDIVNRWDEAELAAVLKDYGEEPHARRLARAIVAARPMRTTVDLAQAVVRAGGGRRSHVHPATRVFQALRIAVNGELEALESALPQAVSVLAQEGRLAVISFHSLEDRLVKRFFQRESRDCICPPEQPVCTCGHRATLAAITRRPIRPEPEEVRRNPRARSARMRVAERLGTARSLHKRRKSGS
ncbi:MAG TPA: 16S rRNA (cytosine(1402)-N(4))-methyltransferase RsmH [Anaerolineales bacterium]|nr:16S rRNA (cytosine(1402)-N(4))-methyltransferase RsmH [Anaerolineales bacterium]